MHMSYASVTRVNPPQRTSQPKSEGKKETPMVTEVSTEFRRPSNIFSANNYLKTIPEVRTGYRRAVLLSFFSLFDYLK